MLSTEEQSRLLQVAQTVAQRAYAPYSNFRVGAAVLTQQGNIFAGCNVENASYGLTICAERAAIFSAIAQEGGDHMRIQAIAVVNEQNLPCSPCGACRQVIFEFGSTAIVLFPSQNGLKVISVAELLPEGFRF